MVVFGKKVMKNKEKFSTTVLLGTVVPINYIKILFTVHMIIFKAVYFFGFWFAVKKDDGHDFLLFCAASGFC